MTHYDDPTPEEREAMNRTYLENLEKDRKEFDKAFKHVQKYMQKRPGPMKRVELRKFLKNKGISDLQIGMAILEAISFQIIYWRVDGLLEAGKAVNFDFKLSK